MTFRSTALWVMLACLTISGLSCSRDPNVRKEKYLELGKRYLSAEKYPEAAIEFSKAIQIDSNFAEAHYQLSRAEIRQGELRAAAYELNKTVTLDPNHLRAHVEFAALLLAAGQKTTAEQQLKAALQLDANDVEAHDQMARLRASQGNMNEAVNEIAKAIQLDPRRAPSYLTQAALQEMQHQSGAAEASLGRALQMDPKFLEGMLAYARLCESQQRWEEAEEWLHRAIDAQPKKVAPRFALGGLLSRRQQPDRAEQVFAEAKKALPNNVDAYNGLANFYLSQKQLDKAAAELGSLVKDHPNDNGTAKKYIAVLIEQSNYAEAQKATDGLLTREKNDPDGLVFRARLLLHDGKVPEAIQAVEAAVKRDRSNAQAHYWSGMAYNASGDIDRAIAEWAEAARLNPRMLEAQRAVAAMAVVRGDRRTLQGTADQLISLNASSAEGYVFRAEADLIDKDFSAAEADLKHATVLEPSNPVPPTRWGDIKLANGKFAEAEKLYEDALRRNSSYVPALRGLVRLYMAEKEPTKALARIDAQLQKAPNNAAFYELKALSLYAQKDSSGSEAAALRAVELSKDNPEAVLLLGQVQASSGNVDNAAAQYEKAIQANPREIRPYLLLGSLEQRRGNWTKAERMYERALQINENPVAANNLAYLLLEHGGNPELALSWAQVARARLPNSPAAADTLAWAYYHKGVYRSAIDLLEGAVRQNPDSALYHYHLGMSYKMAGDSRHAKEHLQRALALDPKLPNADTAKKALSS